MRPIKIARRPNWQRHIKENAYQVDALSDAQQKYWVEALPQPFAIEFDRQEETAIAEATELLWEMCVEFLDWFFTEQNAGDVDRRLTALQIRSEYWQAIKNSWERTEPVEDLSLGARFDLAVTTDGQIKLLEINGETPLLGAETVYQWNWFVDYMHNYQRGKYPLPSDASQFNDFWDAIAGQWRRIVAAYNLKQFGISFLVDENLEEDLEMAMQLIQILQDEVDPNIYTQIVYLRGLKDERGSEIQRGLGLDDDGYFVDHVNDRIPVLWKMYDWSDLQNDMANAGTTQALAARLETGEVKIVEPLWKQVLSNKGALAMMWERFKDSDYRQYLLATYLDTDNSYESTQLLLGMHVRKPMLGLEGVAVSIESGFGSLEQKESFGYGAEGFIIQEYIELPQAFDYHYAIGSWSIDGAAAGIIIRGDTSKITGRHCLIIPHIVSDNGLYIPE
ncbi:glutathionylspermidine synthase family protein [Chamaesiphon polymorphus]|uniref:Glutathionylspermidine synthase n=1 Tax=Chamaesiphon polymorphus CCALA 037 TaxID=2107692 RepID=A0A2T1GHH3_9CYAN|nr:glutathionylspermidine synthase family protein [Chamaesiphon polymorphus]PSB57143.1 glutathionylspermidine synthase [Chamaesiphon polymorphus CCALA 037]